MISAVLSLIFRACTAVRTADRGKQDNIWKSARVRAGVQLVVFQPDDRILMFGVGFRPILSLQDRLLSDFVVFGRRGTRIYVSTSHHAFRCFGAASCTLAALSPAVLFSEFTWVHQRAKFMLF